MLATQWNDFPVNISRGLCQCIINHVWYPLQASLQRRGYTYLGLRSPTLIYHTVYSTDYVISYHQFYIVNTINSKLEALIFNPITSVHFWLLFSFLNIYSRMNYFHTQWPLIDNHQLFKCIKTYCKYVWTLKYWYHPYALHKAYQLVFNNHWGEGLLVINSWKNGAYCMRALSTEHAIIILQAILVI